MTTTPLPTPTPAVAATSQPASRSPLIQRIKEATEKHIFVFKVVAALALIVAVLGCFGITSLVVASAYRWRHIVPVELAIVAAASSIWPIVAAVRTKTWARIIIPAHALVNVVLFWGVGTRIWLRASVGWGDDNIATADYAAVNAWQNVGWLQVAACAALLVTTSFVLPLKVAHRFSDAPSKVAVDQAEANANTAAGADTFAAATAAAATAAYDTQDTEQTRLLGIESTAAGTLETVTKAHEASPEAKARKEADDEYDAANSKLASLMTEYNTAVERTANKQDALAAQDVTRLATEVTDARTEANAKKAAAEAAKVAEEASTTWSAIKPATDALEVARTNAKTHCDGPLDTATRQRDDAVGAAAIDATTSRELTQTLTELKAELTAANGKLVRSLMGWGLLLVILTVAGIYFTMAAFGGFIVE